MTSLRVWMNILSDWFNLGSFHKDEKVSWFFFSSKDSFRVRYNYIHKCWSIYHETEKWKHTIYFVEEIPVTQSQYSGDEHKEYFYIAGKKWPRLKRNFIQELNDFVRAAEEKECLYLG